MGPKIDLHHVVILEHRGVASVGGVVGGTVVEGHAGRESGTRLQLVLFDQLAGNPFQRLSVGPGHVW